MIATLGRMTPSRATSLPNNSPSPSRTTSPDSAAVSVAGLTKTYGGNAVVDRLSFEIPRGVVAGFVGPNGAGKTTTMAMLLGLVRPTGGSGTVLGAPLSTPVAYLGRVGATIEGPALWPGLTGEQNLRAGAATATAVTPSA